MITSKFLNGDPVKHFRTGPAVMLHHLRAQLQRLPKFFRSNPVTIATNCIRNCECLVAYKLRQSHQVLSLYTRLWGETRLKEMLSDLRRRLARRAADRAKALMLSSSMVAMFDWEKNRIGESYMTEHYKDLDDIRKLTASTLTCKNCCKRLVVDVPCPGVSYCDCSKCHKVYNKKVENESWVPFIEREDLLVWRREESEHKGMYEYKVYGLYKEVRADVFFKVQIDTDYRKAWDPTAVEIKVVDSDPQSNSDVLYWEMQWPKFFSNRDYVFNRRYVVDRDCNVIVLTNQITEHPAAPVSEVKHRVTEYYCTMVIKPLTRLDEPGLEFCMTYFDNPGVTIPGPLQAWVATSAMPDFLARLREASRHYPVKEPSLWPDKFTYPGSGVLDDFSTIFLVEDSTPLVEDRRLFNVFKDYFFAS